MMGVGVSSGILSIWNVGRLVVQGRRQQQPRTAPSKTSKKTNTRTSKQTNQTNKQQYGYFGRNKFYYLFWFLCTFIWYAIRIVRLRTACSSAVSTSHTRRMRKSRVCRGCTRTKHTVHDFRHPKFLQIPCCIYNKRGRAYRSTKSDIQYTQRNSTHSLTPLLCLHVLFYLKRNMLQIYNIYVLFIRNKGLFWYWSCVNIKLFAFDGPVSFFFFACFFSAIGNVGSAWCLLAVFTVFD